MTEITSYDLGKILAIEQIAHYQYLKQVAAGSGDKSEYRRAVVQVDILAIEYGLKQNATGDYE